LKLDRAERFLDELAEETRRYRQSKPYEVVTVLERGRPQHRIAIRRPPELMAVIAGDVVYNVHSALNHLAAGLVPRRRRYSTGFPIFWEGVWLPPAMGESRQRLSDRERWTSYTKGMNPEAVEIIKANQPADAPPESTDSTHALTVLNRLRNRDAHSALTDLTCGLSAVEGSYRDGQGRLQRIRGRLDSMEGVANDAPLANVPDDATELTVTGVPHVLFVLGGDSEGGIQLEEGLRAVILDGTRRLVEQLRPYVR
jgi:hypothetical protein